MDAEAIEARPERVAVVRQHLTRTSSTAVIQSRAQQQCEVTLTHADDAAVKRRSLFFPHPLTSRRTRSATFPLAATLNVCTARPSFPLYVKLPTAAWGPSALAEALCIQADTRNWRGALRTGERVEHAGRGGQSGE